jgi:hypothetical protein
MSSLFYQDVTLTIGSQSWSGLRFLVSIVAEAASYSKATVRVYGMSQSSYDGLEYYSDANIFVHTENGKELLFSGIFKLQQRYRDDSSIVSELSLFSSIENYQNEIAQVFEKGSSASDVLNYLKSVVAPVQIYLSDSVSKKISSKNFPGGLTINKKSVFRVINQFFYEYFKETPAFDVNEIRVGIRNQPPILISAVTGMIDVPSFKKQMLIRNENSLGNLTNSGGAVKSRLKPLASVLGTVKINSENFMIEKQSAEAYIVSSNIGKDVWKGIKSPGNGTYVIRKFIHTIDTKGQAYDTEFEFLNMSELNE